MLNEVVENRLLQGWAARLPRAPHQVGAMHETDAELVPLGDGRLLAATVDTVAEEISLGLYAEPCTAGRLAVTAALSDLAAVGAEPIGVLLAVTLPVARAFEVQSGVADGVAEVCDAAGTFVLGGDTNEGPALSISCTAIGVVPASAVMRRTGPRSGDLLFLSGPVGGGAALAGAKLLAGAGAECEQAFRPVLRLRHGRALRSVASGCIDTSDGLLAAVDQLARVNGLGARLERPLAELLHPAAEALCRRLGVGALPLLAAEHGEYELLFAVPPRAREEVQRIGAELGWEPLEIGRLCDGPLLYVEGRMLDGARIRNLWREARGDVLAYVAALRLLT